MEEIITLEIFTETMLKSMGEYLQLIEKNKKKKVHFSEEKQKEALLLVFEISKLFHVCPRTVVSPDRSKKLVFVRCILTIELMRISNTKTNIGIVFLRNHATILHSVNNHLCLVRTLNKEYREYLRTYKNYLKEKGLSKVSINDKPSGRSLFTF